MAAIPPNTTVTSTTPGSLAQQAQAIKEAAASAGIPVWVLLGVYGAESSYGTAYQHGGTTYGYFGLTSPGLWNPSMSFGQDAQTAANLLAKLFKQHGSWDAALQAYSGGGYGESHVMSEATNAPSALKQAIGNLATGTGIFTIPVQGAQAVAGAASSAVGAVGSAVSATESIAQLITSGSFWLRILEGIAAVVLLVLGLRALSGGDGNPVTLVTGAAKKGAQAAAVAA